MTVLAISLTSCEAISEYAIHGQRNPDPELKRIHLMMSHDWDYTEEMLASHPDHDCEHKIKWNYKTNKWIKNLK